ncbi:MAG: hypothetical protein WKF88_09230 [Ferruginibacter sp.]
MLQLPNGCSCSSPSIYPKNWDRTGASMAEDWKIQFYFKDPAFLVKYPRGKFCIVKSGINRYKTLQERRFMIKKLHKEIMDALTVEGFNFISGESSNDPLSDEISTITPIITALNKVIDDLQIVESTRNSIKSALKRIERAALHLRYDHLAISIVTRRHIRAILKECGKQKNEKGEQLPWSACTFNHYRAYLMMLFDQLIEMEAIENDPISKIKKQKEIRKYKVTLTADQRLEVDNHFKSADPYYRRFMHIFFSSSSRVMEMIQLKPTDVNLEKGSFKITVKKGRYTHEDIRPIQDVAKPFWEELLQEATGQKYLFGRLLEPGDKPCPRDYVFKKWHREVCKKLEIPVTLYSLKNLNLDEIAESHSLKDASGTAGHKSTVITMKHYASGEKDRELKRMQKLGKSFAG